MSIYDIFHTYNKQCTLVFWFNRFKLELVTFPLSPSHTHTNRFTSLVFSSSQTLWAVSRNCLRLFGTIALSHETNSVSSEYMQYMLHTYIYILYIYIYIINKWSWAWHEANIAINHIFYILAFQTLLLLLCFWCAMYFKLNTLIRSPNSFVRPACVCV